MQSVLLQQALTVFVEEVACTLHAEVLGGAEVPFELQSQPARRGAGGPALYSYRPLTGVFIAERGERLQRLPTYGEAVRALAQFEDLDRYLAQAGLESPASATARARGAIDVLLGEVFAEQSDFELRPERLRVALARLDRATLTGAAGTTLVATLHGMAISSGELVLTRGLTIARPEMLRELPEGALAPREGEPHGHLVAVLSLDEESPRRAVAAARAVLADLLRALRLFGDGRVALGALAWSRTAAGGWAPLALGAGGRPNGVLLVTPEQEDELRAFCNLVSRRTPEGDHIAWALRRFELGCERESHYEALSDHLLALRALLEPEGPASAMLPGRLAALCALPDGRDALVRRTLQALALEREVILGQAVAHAAAETLAADVADYLRALLRDVICGHLDPDLAGLADEILLEQQRVDAAPTDHSAPHAGAAVGVGVGSAEQVFGDALEADEVLDLSV